jgi:flagellar biosynthesis/type III secretory pathway chaperone
MTTPLQALEHCLTLQLELTRDFLTTVQEEAHLLESPSQADLLPGNTAAKVSCAQQFAELEKARDQALLDMGFEADDKGMQQAMRAHGHLGSVMKSIQDAAAQARGINEQNGIIIRTYLRDTQQMLADLRQLTGQAAEPLYNANGRSQGSAMARRTHIKAA